MGADREALLALAARCEQADGADRVLDGEIWIAVNGWAESDGYRFDGIWCRRGGGDLSTYDGPPLYTASLDAALTLVPTGWDWCVSQGCDEPSLASLSPKMQVSGPIVTASAPALSFCAAALRALAAEASAP